MKMLFIVTRLSTGGAEKALYRLLSSGLEKSGEPAVVSLMDEGVHGARLRAAGIPVYTLNMRRGLPHPWALRRLSIAVNAVRPDLIQGWMYHGNLAASMANKLMRKDSVTVWGVRQSLYSLSNEKVLSRQVIRANRWLSGGVDAIVYNSRVSRRQHEALGFDGRRGHLIPNGFEVDDGCIDTGDRAEVRARLDISDDAVVVGHVARFDPMKDHAGFVKAVVRVAEADGRVHVVLVGAGVDPENKQLRALVPEHLRSRFHWLGERNDVRCLFRAMDAFCLSSWSEAFPNVLGEAMASGVPCVTTDVGDSADIVGDAGIVVPPSDCKALERGLMQMVKKPPQTRRALGEKARERIKTRYGLDSVVRQYADLYRTLVERSSR